MPQIAPILNPTLGVVSIPELTQAQGYGIGTDQFGARSLSLYLRFTPLLWAFGLLSPCAATLLLLLSLRKARWVSFGYITWFWWLTGAMQAVSVVVNWATTDLPLGSLMYRVGGATVTGWFFIGAAIGVGKVYGLRSPLVVRAVCVLGLYLLILGLSSYLIAVASGLDSLTIRSPLAYLFPDKLPFVENSLIMRFFLIDETLGRIIPRLILFYPWSVCLGFAGIAVFMIAWQDSDRRWRIIGMSGGLLGIIGSVSRAAIVAFLIAAAVNRWQHIPRAYRYVAMMLASLTATALLILDISVIDLVSDFYASVTAMRVGSSDARQLGYDESWLGFLRSPVLGNGWPGGYISDTIPMPIGSHSSVYGVLYTGGLLTFLPLCLASAVTLIGLYHKSFSGRPANRAGLSIAVALVLLAYGEGIQSFALPAMFAFCWLGGALGSGGILDDQNTR